jgi:hypothetical protein
MLSHFAVVAEPNDIAPILKERYGGIVDRVQFSVGADTEVWGPVVEAIRAI